MVMILSSSIVNGDLLCGPILPFKAGGYEIILLVARALIATLVLFFVAKITLLA